ncbi:MULTISPECIES: hypothetical protein [unclassified Bradyrhizobium]|uniref:hypothetical protein n=1 Tax=unclassified Bradyrhizobium TaxID=2631580 RepID=UPI001FFA0082|nr:MULTISPECIES: hypothetical protein [unclassified Bradyrhizobium]MCK1613797.1 hypothetical protein [Bradyrhizobium sp. 163]MCK1761774.1 hypothetical protein [Bradyrhizobium sp. 136]
MSNVAQGNTADRDGTRLLRIREFARQVDDEKTQKAVGTILARLQVSTPQSRLAKPPAVV